jgi:hypothetical protein
LLHINREKVIMMNMVVVVVVVQRRRMGFRDVVLITLEWKSV